MYLGGDWEYMYAQGLVNFAESKDGRREAAEALLGAFNSRATFNGAELERAHRYARQGLARALRWGEMSEPSKLRYLKALDAMLPGEVNVMVGFSLFSGRVVRGKPERWPHKDGLRMFAMGTPGVSLAEAVALGLALIVGDRSAWRKRLAHCPVCDKVFIKGGFGKGKPRGTCSEEHRRELHLKQMLEANKRGPRRKSPSAPTRKHK
jgi:hypothetical protein